MLMHELWILWRRDKWRSTRRENRYYMSRWRGRVHRRVLRRVSWNAHLPSLARVEVLLPWKTSLSLWLQLPSECSLCNNHRLWHWSCQILKKNIKQSLTLNSQIGAAYFQVSVVRNVINGGPDSQIELEFRSVGFCGGRKT